MIATHRITHKHEINHMLKTIDAGVLNIGYFDDGDTGAPVVFLMHGFPYDVHAYDEVRPRLAAAGLRVITPYLRGYGPTRFLHRSTPRSGQQAALAHDLLMLMDALHIERSIVSGYDWGGRAACITAALWPERVRGLVSCNGYNLQNIATAGQPAAPQNEHRHWYQYYFHSERGRAGLAENRRELCKLLWTLWSPNWAFDDATFEQSAPSFDNPDFVDVVIQSYRHRYALADGDPDVQAIEDQLAAQPPITVPTIVLDGDGDGVAPIGSIGGGRNHFTGAYEHRVIPRVGHNLPQEAPEAFASAILLLAD
ncbi:MAG: pimeloyl-ACP methyl ester carboxylesterase [Gammaproteobacteria bacterium]